MIQGKIVCFFDFFTEAFYALMHTKVLINTVTFDFVAIFLVYFSTTQTSCVKF